MDGCMDGWKDGRMDGRMSQCVTRRFLQLKKKKKVCFLAHFNLIQVDPHPSLSLSISLPLLKVRRLILGKCPEE